MSRKFANHCLDRLTFGARPSDISAFNSLGANNDARLTAYVNQQLNWSSINDSTFESLVASNPFTTRNLKLKQMWEKHHVHSGVDGFERNLPRAEMERLCIARPIRKNHTWAYMEGWATSST